jgi:hypothetical protein
VVGWGGGSGASSFMCREWAGVRAPCGRVARWVGPMSSPGTVGRGRGCPQVAWWWLCSLVGLIGSPHGLEHTFGRLARRASGAGGGGRPAGRPGAGRAGRRGPGRTGPGPAPAPGPARRTVAPRTRRPRCPRRRRGRGRHAGHLHRQLAASPAADGCRGRPPLGTDRPGAVPRPPDPDRGRPDRGSDLPGPGQRARPRHPRPPRPPMPWPSWPAGLWRAGGCPRPVGSGPS